MPARLVRAALFACLATTTAIGADRKATPPADYPDTPPVGPLLRSATLPKVFSTTLDNGIEVIVVNNDEIPWVSVGWYMLTGAKGDPAGKTGVASMTAQLLRQGTANHDADTLAELLDRHAIAMSGGSGHETSVISAGTLKRHLDLTVELLADVIRRPVFEADAFRRHIQQTLSGLAISEKNGAYLAAREFERRIYGDHYLARAPGGTSATVKQIRREDLIAFHRHYYRPNGSMLLFSGAVSNERAVALARKYFDDWPRGTAPTQTPAAIPAPSKTTIFLVDRPESTQTQIRIGQLGLRRNDPTYPTAQVFNQIFGGGFTSRLNHRIRVVEGLSYGARGAITSGKQPGRLLISSFTRTEATAKTVRALLDEARRMRTDPPTPEEMTDAQSYIIGRFGLSLETPQDVAARIFDLKFHGLAANYYETFLDAIARVTPDDVSAFARNRIDPDRLAIVLVGNADAFEKALADIAPIVRVDSDSDATRPLKVCMVSGSLEYKSDESLTAYRKFLETRYAVSCQMATRRATDDLPGLDALDDCDVMLLFTRRMTIDGEQLDRIKKYCAAGRPIVAVRTASHAFQNWLALDKQVLGGNYTGHYGSGPLTQVTLAPTAADHPILRGVRPFRSVGSLYKNTPLRSDTTRLLTGTTPEATEPIAWVREHNGGRVFYTSLGHPQDFRDKNFQRMLANALFWAARREPVRR